MDSKCFLEKKKKKGGGDICLVNIYCCDSCYDLILIRSFFLTVYLHPCFVFRMKEVTVGDKKVLLVCTRGQYSAIGSQCSHYNAPLVKGKPSTNFSPSISVYQYLVLYFI